MRWLILALTCAYRVGVDCGGAEVRSAPPECLAGAPDGGGDGADASTPVPMDPVAGCGRPSTYVDDFDDGRLGPEWLVPFGVATETSGRLALDVGLDSVASAESRFAVNLSDDRLRVELPGAPADGAVAEIGLRAASGGELAFFVSERTLLISVLGGASPIEFQASYDPALHRWLQIREAGGLVFWETSPDAIDWTTRFSIGTPPFAGNVRIVLGVRAIAGQGGAVSFARLNAGRPRAPWCPAETQRDDFEDGVMGAQWQAVVSGACSVVEASGQAAFTMSGAGASFCAYESTPAFDLRESTAYLEIPAIVSFYPPVSFFLGVETAAGQTAELAFVGSNVLEHSASTLSTEATAYSNPGNEDWWRLRGAAGTLSWETSGDGRTWTVKRQVPAPFDLSAVRLRFGVRTDAPMPSSIVIRTLQFNVGGL